MSEHGKYCDRRGIPIYPGDLLKTDHFRERNGRQHYLYHTVVDEDGHLFMVPTSHLEPTKVAGGGKCLLLACVKADDPRGLIPDAEIILGSGPGECLCFRDRPRVRLKKKEK